MRRRSPPLLRGGLGLVALLALAGLAAPLLAPYDPAEQIDPPATRLRPPLTRLEVVRLADGRALAAEAVRPVPGGLLVRRLGAERVLPAGEVVNRTADGVGEARLFLLGSDRFGRDVLSRIVHGARLSLGIALGAVALALSLGLLVGGVAGAAGGLVDRALMRLVDAALAFPRLFLVLALAALLEADVAIVVLVLGGTGWMGTSRLVRAQVIAWKRRDVYLAARGVGVHPAVILLRHLLPNAAAPLLVDVALTAGDLILVEAALSFLGLGVQPPDPSWGNMIAGGRDVLLSAPWISAFAGAAVTAAVLGFHLVGDGLRDLLDPRTLSELHRG